MAQYNKLFSTLFGLSLTTWCIGTYAQTLTSSGSTEFTATIINGDCQWTWNETSLNFSVLTPQQVSPATTLEIKPLTAMIQCNIPITPEIIFSGSTPYPNNTHVFINGNMNSGMGFMLQLDDGNKNMPSLGSFYSDGLNGKAISNNAAISINKIIENEPAQQTIWVGLVGMKESTEIIPGSFSASLIVTGIIP